MDKDQTVTCCHREAAFSVLRNRARQMRDEAHRMEVLADQLEFQRLSPDAEDALWDILTRKS